MQRRNIRKVEYAERDGQPAHSGYACECREITESELRMLESIEEINTDKAVTAAIDKYTEELIMEGVIG